MRKTVVIGIILAFTHLVGARTIIVGFDETTTLRTIQDGIDNAQDGDEVVVLDGLYSGPGNRDLDYRGREITVRSANGPTHCVIDCEGSDADPHRGFIFLFQGINSVVEGFSIRGGLIVDNPAHDYRGVGLGGAIFCLDSHVVIRNCIFVHNTAPVGGAIATAGSSRGFRPRIINCTFTNNSADQGGSLYCGEFTHPELSNCILWGNTAAEGAEIAMHNLAFGSDLTIRYSDIRGGREGIWGVGFAGRLIWGDGNLDLDPRFIDPNRPAGGGSVAVGDLHLASASGRWNAEDALWVQDDGFSPCIDAGIASTAWGGETWPNGLRLNMGAYGGSAQASRSPDLLTELADPNNREQEKRRHSYLKLAADFTGNRAVDLLDFALFAQSWKTRLSPGKADLTEDGRVDTRDLETLCRFWLPAPVEAGEPLPMRLTWAEKPTLVEPNGSVMVAATAFSTDGGGVEYYFEDPQDPQFNSAWLSFPTGQPALWGETDLEYGKSYLYRVRARNQVNLLETDWASIEGLSVPSADMQAPLPNPPRWQTRPYWKNGSLTIAMASIEVLDESGVEYRFECLSRNDLSSPWQNSPEYEVTAPSKDAYTFLIWTRDKSTNQNRSDPSEPAAPNTDPPAPDPMTWAEGGWPRLYNPTGNSFNWFVTMTAVTATDPDGEVEYYFQCVDESGFDSGWQSESTYNRLLGNPRNYGFRVKARDVHGNETQWSEILPAL
jgi:predicted outer membrane repeat protein